MSTTTVLAISGSLQATSTNTALVHTIANRAPDDVDVVIYQSLAQVPPFNPDLDRDPAPPPIAELRAAVQAANGVIIAAPEYAHGMPGVLKNALDWLVGSGELYDKPVAVVSVSPRPNGGAHARQTLELTLRAQGAHVVASTTLQASRDQDRRPELPEPATGQLVHHMLDALRRARPAAS